MKALILFFILSFRLSHASDIKLCENILLKEGRVNLNGNEKVLVCGSNADKQVWQDVPLAQGEFHLRDILKNLGYFHPRFTKEDRLLKVWTGPRSEIKSLQVEGAKGVLDPSKKRNIVGHALTPGKINEVEAWANMKVRSNGYACPQIIVEAHSWDETVHVDADLGEQKRIGGFTAPGLEGLSLSTLDRYKPFSIGDIYNIRETQIMAERLLADGLFQSAFFETMCDQDEALLELQTSVGKPKIFRFGIGASTEEWTFIDISFRNARLDSQASSITTTLHISPRQQSLAAESELYWFPGWTKIFFGPRLRLAREIESVYQTDSGRVGADIGRRWDMWNSRFMGRWGPTLNFVKTSRGIGPENSQYPSVDASLIMMSHVYESLMWQQYEGWNGSILFRGHGKNFGSQVDVNRYEINYKYLWNIGNFSSPLFVLGTRLQAITVDAPELRGEDQISLIPIEDRVFVGGNRNLRGFPRNSIDNQGRGFLSFLYAGLELRLIDELPYRLQPFLLLDLGQTGNSRHSLDSPVFVSEGVGLRWLSPFGTFRGSLAKGKSLYQEKTNISYPEQWVFFLSFGEEF